MSKASKQEWDAETIRLEKIRRSYWAHIKLIDEARQEGVTSHSMTDENSMEQFWLIDRDGRILTGQCSDFFETWVTFVAGKGKS